MRDTYRNLSFSRQEPLKGQNYNHIYHLPQTLDSLFSLSTHISLTHTWLGFWVHYKPNKKLMRNIFSLYPIACSRNNEIVFKMKH